MWNSFKVIMLIPHCHPYKALLTILTVICFSGFSMSVVKTCVCFLPMLQWCIDVSCHIMMDTPCPHNVCRWNKIACIVLCCIEYSIIFYLTVEKIALKKDLKNTQGRKKMVFYDKNGLQLCLPSITMAKFTCSMVVFDFENNFGLGDSTVSKMCLVSQKP